MRLSISARVTIACTLVIVMALALLATGLSVSNKIHRADLRITLLSDALSREDLLDQAQRRLRQDIGRLTRDAERGVKVPDARWEDLHGRIAAFKRRSSQAARSPGPGSGEVSGVVTGVEDAAAIFAAASDQLIETSRFRPSGIKAAMPRFLSALTALENSRSQSRRELT